MNENEENEELKLELENLGLDTGDIVLFNRRCFSMSPYGALICTCAKFIGNTKWDHIGIIVKDQKTGENQLLEASLGGIKMRPLYERLKRSSSYEIAIRKLQIKRDIELRSKIDKFVEEIKDTKYENSLFELLLTATSIPSKNERVNLYRDILNLEQEINEINYDLKEKKLSPFQVMALNNELNNLTNVKELKTKDLQSTQESIFERTDEKENRRVVCSELVALFLMKLELLHSYPPSSSYTPKDFSSSSSLILSNKGVKFSSEKFITSLDINKENGNFVEKKNSKAMSNVELSRLNQGERRQMKKFLSTRLTIDDDQTNNDIEKLLDKFEVIDYFEDEVLFMEGEEPKFFLFILSGNVDLFSQNNLITSYGRNNDLGSSAIVHRRNRKTTAVVHKAEGARIARLDSKNYFSLVEKYLKQARPKGKSKTFLRKIINSHPLFSKLSEEEKEESVNSFRRQIYKNENLITQGELGSSMFIIEKGVVDIVVSKSNQINIRERRGRGETLGEAALVTNYPRGATVRAEGEVVCWALDRNSFTSLTKANNRFLYSFFASKSSILIDGDKFMTPQDLLGIIEESNTIREEEKEMILQIISGSNSLISFSEFCHFDLMLNTENLESELAFLFFSRGKGAIYLEDFVDTLSSFNNTNDENLLRDAKKFFSSSNFLTKFEFFDMLESKTSLFSSLENYIFLLKERSGKIQEMWKNVKFTKRIKNDNEGNISLSSALHGEKRGKTNLQLNSNSLILKPSTANIISALLASIISRTIVAPLEKYKIMRQVSLVPNAALFYKKSSSILSFWSGNLCNVIRLLPTRSTQVFVFSKARDSNLGKGKSEIEYFLAGCMAGVVSTSIAFPLDLIRTKLTVQENKIHYKGIFDCFNKIFKNEGIKSLYRGYFPSLLGIIPYLGLNYTLFNVLKPLALTKNKNFNEINKNKYNREKLLLASFISLGISSSVVYPLDVIRHNIMIRSDFQTTRQAFKSIYNQKGVFGFYQGLIVNFIKIVPSIVITHYSFDFFLSNHSKYATS